MKIDIGNGFALSPITSGDKVAYVQHLNDREIYLRTLNIPFPYDTAAADWWIGAVAESTQRNSGKAVSLAIRDAKGMLVGGIGFDGLVIGKTHRAEIGYWLAKLYWGKGIMTAAVAKACDLGFSEYRLEKITAHIFAFNTASQRVLEKNGFLQEGELRRHYLKDGEVYDGKLFARLK